MASSSAARLLWSCKAPLAGAFVINRALTLNHHPNAGVTSCEKQPPNVKLQKRVSSDSMLCSTNRLRSIQRNVSLPMLTTKLTL